MKKILLVILCGLLVSSCASTRYIEKQSEALSEGFYATSDSLNHNPPLISLAKQYIQKTSPLVALPKKRIPITGIEKKDEKNVNTFEKISSTQLKVNEDNQNKLIQDLATSQAENKEYHDSFEYKIKHFFTTLKWIIPIGGAALVVLCIFNPAILPVIMSIGGTILGILMKIFNIGLEIISNIFGLFMSKTSV